MKSNGVEDIEREVIGYMPRGFVLMYYELVEKAFVQYTSPLGHAGESGGMAKKKYTQHNGGLKDEAAMAEKKRVDGALRRIVRAGDRMERRKCTACTKFIDEGWRFCAHCGASTTGEQVKVEQPKKVAVEQPAVKVAKLR
ncbi:hypothetical protein PP997_gp65 [Gordonia phage BigChungus]|uniref:Zinc ribbon domain-containing protein n=1 Tax=Gordonia phage BigChungus TaxID=2762389 RepID=A0A7G8LQP3_9CAUD|nr:hypothetical protein PP997_gp65 [Gordonia phage BigChungus]QNJ59425.1 hypothetical protein SEA_FEASTONYEET_65 [Gordonia phage Feastonyeet]QNJ59565.1 hypothetical protein SEA_BIGCHUNGUS_65 [Gordonia phage BigChungus]